MLELYFSDFERPMTDNGNAMFQSYLSKLFKKETGWRYALLYLRYGGHGKKKMFFEDYLFTLLYAAELALSR